MRKKRHWGLKASTQSLGAYFGGISGPGIALRETSVCPKEPRGKPPCKRAHIPLTPKPNLGIVIFKKSGFSSPAITAMKDLEVDVALRRYVGHM